MSSLKKLVGKQLRDKFSGDAYYRLDDDGLKTMKLGIGNEREVYHIRFHEGGIYSIQPGGKAVTDQKEEELLKRIQEQIEDKINGKLTAVIFQ